MPEFFPFIPGTETSPAASRSHGADSTSPLLGRFRAVPPRTTPSSSIFSSRRQPPSSRLGSAARRSLIDASKRGSVHVGYGAVIAAGLDDDDGDSDEDWSSDEDDAIEGDGSGNNKAYRMARVWRRTVRKTRRNVEDLWVAPRHGAVRRVVETWWSRWGLLVFFPAVLAVAWCAIPFPQYPLDASHSKPYSLPDIFPPTTKTTTTTTASLPDHRAPGHGEARVQVNFWFFLLVYYGFYNLTALIWITKVFNLYSLNWWPAALGFPLTVSLIAVLSLAAPVPVYLAPASRFLTVHNTAWIGWTFLVMALPVAIAFGLLVAHERHLGLRHSLSETQRIFTSSWWTGEGGGSMRDHAPGGRRGQRWGLGGQGTFDPDAAILQIAADPPPPQPRGFMPRRRWLPASFVRFVWFCLALAISLLAYLIGEAYAEIYLRTLPHSSWETIIYVYSWVVTVHLLDLLTGWILGGNEGERVGSYPLSWIFKLYFMLTYQTYVRALYARLRSPQQFILLQALSSSFLIILTPLTMTKTYHRALTVLGLTGQSYGSYQKICTRNVFIRFLAENVSMLTFLGSILVLHFGPNTDVYPYFAFDDPDEPYNFKLTLVASTVTWACELAAGVVLRGLIRWIFGVNANIEGRMDLAVWPELLPTSIAVMVHVLQNMLFSIIRLHFR
ncbi:putative conserved fungal protein [Rosellinia necatrix]|uniref:Putative conserved fungal protein n=1 Tax=Rosellinia necatrix TaxID=77044 RepID=A0A1S7UM15_ROSNE|nr:putative conserved fungal protein [Rosellinia necatrix]